MAVSKQLGKIRIRFGSGRIQVLWIRFGSGSGRIQVIWIRFGSGSGRIAKFRIRCTPINLAKVTVNNWKFCERNLQNNSVKFYSNLKAPPSECYCSTVITRISNDNIKQASIFIFPKKLFIHNLNNKWIWGQAARKAIDPSSWPPE